MSTPLYEALKGQAYATLATLASCDHGKAASKGYKDGWQMLLDKHEENEMTVFCTALPNVMSAPQAKLLLDGLAREYTQFSNWLAFVEVCTEQPNWKPSRGPLVDHQHKAE